MTLIGRAFQQAPPTAFYHPTNSILHTHSHSNQQNNRDIFSILIHMTLVYPQLVITICIFYNNYLLSLFLSSVEKKREQNIDTGTVTAASHLFLLLSHWLISWLSLLFCGPITAREFCIRCKTKHYSLLTVRCLDTEFLGITYCSVFILMCI